MSLPTADTTVTYPAGAITGRSTVLHREDLPDGRVAVLLDETPVHPVDAGWPDQGPDHAFLRTEDGSAAPVVDAVVGATDGRELFIGSDVPVRRGTEGWSFVVVHVLPAGSHPREGDVVEVSVDGAYRRALSAGHTACHAASLALNRRLAGAWKKDAPRDAAGNPNFDALAIETSTILEDGSRDIYRLGRSLRRKGFQGDVLLAGLADIEADINATLAEWVAAASAVRIDVENNLLTGLRRWICDLPEGTVAIPCGGTHLASLGEAAAITVALSTEETDGATVLTMVTTAQMP